MPTKTDAPASLGLACPACGNDGRAGVLRYLVYSAAAADVIAVRHGVVELAGPPRDPAVVSTMRPHVECRGLRDDGRLCGHTFALPTSITGVTWKVGS